MCFHVATRQPGQNFPITSVLCSQLLASFEKFLSNFFSWSWILLGTTQCDLYQAISKNRAFFNIKLRGSFWSYSVEPHGSVDHFRNYFDYGAGTLTKLMMLSTRLLMNENSSIWHPNAFDKERSRLWYITTRMGSSTLTFCPFQQFTHTDLL